MHRSTGEAAAALLPFPRAFFWSLLFTITTTQAPARQVSDAWSSQTASIG